ncbi:hypothetical protein PR202_ga26782 [Eleusine coracana subsp. coracana]|uniref:Uncharacterized protein n=1 Tax=Eleusine coracana subsp. coracana TaxID=191504 RepID=A0AAV5DEF5_ELECO|nr:hypothetical protein PR202_ga26782 [Eleusine coracana subsp. coracana]
MVSEPKSNGAATAMAGKKVVVPGPAQEISEEQMLQFHNMVSEPKSNGAATAMAGKKVVVPGPAQEISEEQMLQFHRPVILPPLEAGSDSLLCETSLTPFLPLLEHGVRAKSNGAATAMAGKKVVVPGPA